MVHHFLPQSNSSLTVLTLDQLQNLSNCTLLSRRTPTKFPNRLRLLSKLLRFLASREQPRDRGSELRRIDVGSDTSVAVDPNTDILCTNCHVV